MNFNHKQTSRQAIRRRGSAYIMVMGVSTVLAVIGLSAVAVSRVQTRQITQAGNWNDAQILAFSGIEHALAKMNADGNWRNTYNGTSTQQTLGGGSITWSVSDAQDGNLIDDPTDQATLSVSATAGGATYSLKVALNPAGGASGLGGAGGGSSGSIKLWGIDEDDNELFSIDDYINAPHTVVSYSKPLKWRNKYGYVQSIWGDIEAMTIDSAGVMYVAVDQDIDNYDAPVLAKFDLANASTTQDNVLTVVGEINSRHIVGLAIDPTTGIMYGLAEAGGSDECILYTINKTTAAAVELGETVGLGEDVDKGEDIEFDESGNLYLADDDDDRLYRLNKATGALVEVVDNNLPGSKVEALAWDAVNDRMLASETGQRKLYHITLQNSNNSMITNLGSRNLTDVEGMSFVPPTDAKGQVVPAPSSTAIQRVVE